MKTGEPFRRPVFPTLALIFATGTVASPPGTAQTLVETRPGTVRIQDAAGATVDIVVGEGRIARSAAAAEGGYVVAGEDPATADLFFLLASGDAVSGLPVPPRRDPTERARPALLTRRGRLDGAVWLEGSATGGLAVVGSVWNGTSWERVEAIAPANGRPQLAPAAAALDDGSWVAVWAGFDGEDDEIFWSRRRDGVWSKPQRVHEDNRVPDLLPALAADAADGDRALAAWSFYDGSDYRVRVARFESGRWAVGEPLEGLGAGRTGWQKAGGRSFVVYRSVVPEAWTAIELDAFGGVLHQVTEPSFDRRPPLVEAAAGRSAPRLFWPGGAPRPRR